MKIADPKSTGPHNWVIVGGKGDLRREVVDAVRRAGGETTWVVSGTEKHARRFAAANAISRATAELPEALSDPKVSAVYIASYDSDQVRTVIMAAEAGKHVLCDKLSARTADVLEMIRTCERHGITFGVNHFLRASPLHRRMQEMIAEGVIGDVRSVLILHANATPDNLRLDALHDPGSRAMYFDLSVHDIDLARFLLKQEPLTVVGVGSSVRGRDSLLQDQAMYSIVMSGGAFLQVHESFATPFVQSQVFVLGSLGYLHARGTLNQRPSGSLSCVMTGEVKTIPAELLDPDVEMIQRLLEAIGSNSRPLATGWDGLAAVTAAEAVAAAIASGRAVNVASGRHVSPAIPTRNVPYIGR